MLFFALFFVAYLALLYLSPRLYGLSDMVPRLNYSRDFLTQLRPQPGIRLFCPAPSDYFPEEILRGPPTNQLNSNKKTRKTKVTRRGLKKGGVRARLKRETHKQRALPSIILANVRSLRNKLDELQACVNHLHEFRTASVLAFTESWLNNNDDDGMLHIDGFSPPLRLDRDSERTGKQHGGGVCLYVNNSWCSTVKVREKLCTTDIELLVVSLRPYYLPREFPQLFIILVYIHPRANAAVATEHLISTLHKLEQLSPDSPKFILGDFNHCSPDKSLKGFQQYITCSTRQGKTLDKCYGSVPHAFKALPLPPLGSADHHTILLAPAYIPVIRRIKRVTKDIKQWTAESILTLQGCFESTDWDSLLSPSDDINKQVDTVSSYISFCVDSIIPSKTVTIYPNNKPWITKELKEILNKKKRIFFTGSALDKTEVNREVKRAIKMAKLEYKNKVEEKFTTGNLRSAWQGLKTMASVNTAVTTSTRNIQVECSNPSSLPDDLNVFYTRFESDNITQLEETRSSLKPGSSALTFRTEDVVRALRKTRERSSPGPDNISSRVLRHCAGQLGSVFRTLFQHSLDSHTVPQLWKQSTVIPIPKKTNPKTLNDLRPVALTSLVMKAMEKIIKQHIISVTDPLMDPLQFAFRTGRGVDDAKIFIMDTIHKHLELPDSSVRLLFADFSSAFNTLQPHILATKLSSHFHLDDQLILWTLDFLTNRTQKVRVNNSLSGLRSTSTGSPQGCVLSPLFFILYTDDCRSTQPNCHLVKYADDTVLLSLLSGPSQHHGPVLQEFVEWCDSSNLELNVSKTKDMVVTFSSRQKELAAAVTTTIHGMPVEVVEEYKYLGTIFDNLLKFSANTENILKKCHQRLYLLRKLNSFGVSTPIMMTFYYAFLESIMTFSMSCWFHSLSLQNRNRLQHIAAVSSKVIGQPVRTLAQVYSQRALRQAAKIINDPSHILHSAFQWLPSGRRLRCTACRTERRRATFVPKATLLFNSSC